MNTGEVDAIKGESRIFSTQKLLLGLELQVEFFHEMPLPPLSHKNEQVPLELPGRGLGWVDGLSFPQNAQTLQ